MKDLIANKVVKNDRLKVAWERAMETLRDALLLAQVVDHREAVQGVT